MIEMLIVLSSFLMLSFATTFLFAPQNVSLEKTLFFSQLKSDLLFGQQYAISHQEKIIVHIMPEKNYYYIRSNEYGDAYLVKRHYSPDIKIVKGTMSLYFQYMPNGNVDSFGSIYIKIGTRTYKLMVLIGKGRFYVAEE